MRPQDQKILALLCEEAQRRLSYIDAYCNSKSTKKHIFIERFQDLLWQYLDKNEGTHIWEKEKKANSNVNDSIDLFGERKTTNDYDWVVEIDATRADQVAKKFTSRLANCGLTKRPIIYVALLYPDTQSGINECKKYIKFLYDIIKAINKNSAVVGVYLDNSKSPVEIWDNNLTQRFYYNGKRYKGMNATCSAIIESYIKSNRPTWPKLTKKFGTKYIATSPNTQHNSTPLNTKTSDGCSVYTFNQFRKYGFNENWSPFVNICKRKKISINEMKYVYDTNKKVFVWIL